MSKENRVSDERLTPDQLLEWASDANNPLYDYDCVPDSVIAGCIALARELQSLRSKPVAGVPQVLFDKAEALERSLDSEGEGVNAYLRDDIEAAIAAMRSTLSLPAQEPIIWQARDQNGHWVNCVNKQTAEHVTELNGGEIRPLYASPQPEAVITEEMVERAARALHANSKGKHNHFLPFEDLSAQRILWLREDASAALTVALKEA